MTFLSVLFLIVSVLLIVAVLLRSGKDGGLSGAFGVGQNQKASGTMVEKNLNRWLVALVAVWVVVSVLLVK